MTPSSRSRIRTQLRYWRRAAARWSVQAYSRIRVWCAGSCSGSSASQRRALRRADPRARRRRSAPPPAPRARPRNAGEAPRPRSAASRRTPGIPAARTRPGSRPGRGRQPRPSEPSVALVVQPLELPKVAPGRGHDRARPSCGRRRGPARRRSWSPTRCAAARSVPASRGRPARTARRVARGSALRRSRRAGPGARSPCGCRRSPRHRPSRRPAGPSNARRSGARQRTVTVES